MRRFLASGAEVVKSPTLEVRDALGGTSMKKFSEGTIIEPDTDQDVIGYKRPPKNKQFAPGT